MRFQLVAISLLLIVISCSQDRARSISFSKKSRESRNETQDLKPSDDLVIELEEEDRALPPPQRTRRSASMKFVQEAESLVKSEKKRDIGIQVLEKAINVDPANPFAFFMLGRAFSKEERYEAAAAAYSKAATYFKNKPNWLLESCLQMGVAYEKISQKERALESYKRALEIEPENGFAQRRIKRLE